MDDQIQFLQERLGSILEKFLAVRTAEKFSAKEIASHWFKEINANVKVDSVGKRYAPDQFTLSMFPSDYEDLIKADELSQSKLSIALKLALEEAQFTLNRDPNITLATDPTLPVGGFRVIAWHSSDPVLLAERIQIEEDSTQKPPKGAFFIIEGRRHFPLDKTLINIGRRLDNHLVLEDPHVSRRHAQLRVRKGRFILYDLDSTAGTFVNETRVQEWELQPGDVLLVATVRLIYGEDPGGPPEVTPPYAPPFTRDFDRDQVTPLDLSHIDENRRTQQLDDRANS